MLVRLFNGDLSGERILLSLVLAGDVKTGFVSEAAAAVALFPFPVSPSLRLTGVSLPSTHNTLRKP